MTRKTWCLVLLWAGALGCAGKSDEPDTDDQTANCVPYCDKLEGAGCNELGSVENCRLACGLLLTEPAPCGPATRTLMDCQMRQPNICSGCSAEQTQATNACQ